MNIGDFNLKQLGKSITSNNTINSNVSNFMKELSDFLEKNKDKKLEEKKVVFGDSDRIYNLEREISQIKQNIQEINNSKNIDNGDICVVYGMRDEKITLLNIENGKEFDIYVSISEDSLNSLHDQGIYSNIYEMNENDFYNLDLGSKLIMKNGNFEVYNGEIDIKDDEVWYKLDELYGNLKDDENKNFVVKDVTERKVYLTYEDGGGFISRYKEAYPDFKVGDLVKRVNGKFIKE